MSTFESIIPCTMYVGSILLFSAFSKLFHNKSLTTTNNSTDNILANTMQNKGKTAIFEIVSTVQYTNKLL